MDDAPVHVQVRTGNGAHYVLDEDEWPIARTTYRRWYLDATPSDWDGDGRRSDLLRISSDDTDDGVNGAATTLDLDRGRADSGSHWFRGWNSALVDRGQFHQRTVHR